MPKEKNPMDECKKEMEAILEKYNCIIVPSIYLKPEAKEEKKK